LEEQPDVRLRTSLPGTISIKEALTYNMTLPVSTTIIGVDSVAQIEENIKIASGFSPLSQLQMEEIEFKTIPIIRQGLYFRRWDIGV
jgi:predicted aldo/keto reductase-like oxidoreductase